MAIERTFVTAITVINQSRDIPSDCNSIGFKNQGSSTVYVAGLRLLPGESFFVPYGNAGELDKTQWNIRFNGVGTNELVVLRKTYQ